MIPESSCWQYVLYWDGSGEKAKFDVGYCWNLKECAALVILLAGIKCPECGMATTTIFGYIDGVPWSFAHLHIKHSRHTQFMHPLRL